MADLLTLEGLRKSFGALCVADAVSLTVAEQEIHALIGPNGAGKTTLMSLVHGSLAPEAGRITLSGIDLTSMPVELRVHEGLARTFQISSLVPESTVMDNMHLSLIGHTRQAFRFMDTTRQRKRREERALAELSLIGLEGEEATIVTALSHGQRRRLELAMAMVRQPRVMLADEPLAGLGTEGMRDMLDVFRDLRNRTSILLVEHDMDAVFALSDRISVLVRGRLIATGTPDEIRQNEDVRHAYLGEDFSR